MASLRLVQDIQPLSEFRSSVASYIRQINETRRSLVITQHGKGVAVLLEELRTAETRLASGTGVSNEDARSLLLALLQK